MHSDYKTRLTALSDKLTDVVLEEADPDNWPGAGKEITKHTKVHSLIGMHTRGGTPKPGEDPDDEAFRLGQQVSAAERAAQEVIERLQQRKK